MVSPIAIAAASKALAQHGPVLAFKEIEAGIDERHHVAEGYDADILLRWGDPVVPGGPPLDVRNQTKDTQLKQFGYNNDFIGYVPMPGAANPSEHGVLVVNHESANSFMMRPGLTGADRKLVADWVTKDIVEIEMAAHGGSVVEVRKRDGKWAVVADSRYARRITAETEMEITGPAAGHERMQTRDDPTGRKVRGMLSNCAGGVTPWGTWLSGEENAHQYFWGTLDDSHPEASGFRRYGVPGRGYRWGLHHERFDITKEPREANRFGWVVEIDPLDPAATPKKHTALGRFRHEGAEGVIARDGRYVVYSGDDDRFWFVYKFVTAGRVNPNDRTANMNLLADGTLYAARYDKDGSGEWLPLVAGQGKLTPENGFRSQADVLIDARRAAEVAGATKMDRPEDIEADPKSGKVYVALTKNENRKPEQVDAANPRADNKYGHILEMMPDGGDHAAVTFRWDILLKCGDPADPETGGTFSPSTTSNGWFANPDNFAIDGDGHLWVATDGNSHSFTKRADGLWAVMTSGTARATSKHFFRSPVGGEATGPCFTPDSQTLFVAVQHPGRGGEDWPPFGRTATFEDPASRWPDFQDDMPPRPSILAITKRGGGRIGS
jgi:secreted PhoX family phosphatase